MYLNLLYNGKKFVYEANNKLNIGHLKEISEKILNSDKNLMHIIYNNNKYIFPNDKTFLKDLIPKGQKKTAFSIKVDDTNNDEKINDINSKTPIPNRKSFDEIIKSKSIKKNIFKNISNMWNNQKKFNSNIAYKINELLIEIREFNRRINEIYEELFNNYTQSNINYNNFLSETNCNDVNEKLTDMSKYEFQMFKFIDKEKYYYKKLNILIKNCLFIQNNKIFLSNKNLEDLYEKMFNETFRNSDFNYQKEETEFNSDYKNKLIHFDPKNTNNLDNTSLSTTKKKLLQIEDSFLNKTIKINKKKALPLISNDNIIGNKEIIGSKDKKMIISTELGSDGIQRGKITIFSEDNKKSKFKIKNKNNNNNNDNKKIEEEDVGEEKEKEKEKEIEKVKEKENEENFPVVHNLIKNRLIFRNKKTKDSNFVHFNTKDEGAKNKSILKNIASERFFGDKNKLNNLKIIKQKSTIEVNNNLDIINRNKNIFNKKMKSNNNLNIIDKITSNKSNNNAIKFDKNVNINNEKNKNKSSKSINEIKNNKNKSSKSINEIKNNKKSKEKKEDKENKIKKKDNKTKDNETNNSAFKSNISDSSDIAKNKNDSRNNSISIKNSNNNNGVIKLNLSSSDTSNKELSDRNAKSKKDLEKNKSKNKNDKSENNNIDKNEKRNSKENKSGNKNGNENINIYKNEKDNIKDNNKNSYNILSSLPKDSENSNINNINNNSSNKKKKKRKSSNDEDFIKKEDKDQEKEKVIDNGEKNGKKIIKRRNNNDSISEENNGSDESKKVENKDYIEDINILKSLLTDKDNPYKKNRFAIPNKRRNNIFENNIIKAEPENNSDEDEQKKINLLKRKKKQLIKNKYDFLI